MAKVIHFKGSEGAAWNGPVVIETSPGVFEERYVTPTVLASALAQPQTIAKLQSPSGAVFLLSVNDDGEIMTTKEGDTDDSKTAH